MILEKCPRVQYLYTWMNNNQIQRELFNNMFGSSFSDTGPLRGGHDADAALGEDECDAPALSDGWSHAWPQWIVGNADFKRAIC